MTITSQKTASFRCSPRTLLSIDKHAEQQGLERSVLLRKIVEDHIEAAPTCKKIKTANDLSILAEALEAITKRQETLSTKLEVSIAIFEQSSRPVIKSISDLLVAINNSESNNQPELFELDR